MTPTHLMKVLHGNEHSLLKSKNFWDPITCCVWQTTHVSGQNLMLHYTESDITHGQIAFPNC